MSGSAGGAAAILFLVPARGGSKRVPGKNLRLVGGIPLVARAVRTGLAASAALGGAEAGHRVVCSTDDAGIAETASAWGADILRRPVELATDTATSVEVALHALEAADAEAARAGGVPFRTLVLLQPTSPLIEAADVLEALELHPASGGRSVTGVAASHPAAWHHAFGDDGTLTGQAATAPGVPGGEAAPTRMLSGAVYVIETADLRVGRRFVEPGRTLGSLIPAERAVDVDEEVDLLVAEALLAARPVRPVPLGHLEAGTGRVIVIAEGGVNHNGDEDLALRLIDAAADAGADVVKFQTFDPAALAAADAPAAEYQRRAGAGHDGQREMLERLALPADAWPRLAAHAAARGIVFLSTPFDDASAELLHRLGVPAFKIGSGELTNIPFIARVAARGRPMLVSTGMGDMREVASAVDAVRSAGNPPLALFHCVSSYPASPGDANLAAMETMRRAFGVPTGWSDHTPGIEMALAATAMGAALVEKHITLDRTLPGPDHAASLEPGEMAAMVAGIRAVEAARGSGLKVPVAAELDVAAVARRSLHWARALPAGHVIGPEDLAILRPGTGIRPEGLAAAIGRTTARPVEAGRMVEPEDLGVPV